MTPDGRRGSDGQRELAQRFAAARPRLIRVAYAILGSRAEAEDVVSEVWVRLAAADATDPVLDVDAWTTVAVSRGALDEYRSARRRRDHYVGPWLPEPVLSELTDPADRVTLDESVSFALLVVLESLTPAERTAWVLHDLFDMPFAEVAEVVGRSPTAVRQLAARARKHLRAQAPRVPVDAGQHLDALSRFSRAAAGGDLGGLLLVLDPEVRLTSDGGGHVTAARRPIDGADKVSRFLVGTVGTAAGRPSGEVRSIDVNGLPGIGIYEGAVLVTVIALTVRDGLITRVDVIRSPSKLSRSAISDTAKNAR